MQRKKIERANTPQLTMLFWYSKHIVHGSDDQYIYIYMYGRVRKEDLDPLRLLGFPCVAWIARLQRQGFSGPHFPHCAGVSLILLSSP